MRIVTTFIAAALTLGLSGCQHLNLLKTEPTAHKEMQTQPTLLNQLLHRTSGRSIQDYPAACLAQSKLNQPTVVGQVIDTPRYAMLTLAKQQHLTQVMGGELCIVNKINHHIEITAVDDLRFIAPAVSSTDGAAMSNATDARPTKP